MSIKVCPSFSILLGFFYLLIDYITYRVPIPFLPDDYRCSDSTSPSLITFFWVTPPEYRWHASAGMFFLFWNFVHRLAIGFQHEQHVALVAFFMFGAYPLLHTTDFPTLDTGTRSGTRTLSRIIRICQFISVCIVRFSFISIYCWHNGWFNYYWILSLIDSLVSCMFLSYCSSIMISNCDTSVSNEAL